MIRPTLFSCLLAIPLFSGCSSKDALPPSGDGAGTNQGAAGGSGGAGNLTQTGGTTGGPAAGTSAVSGGTSGGTSVGGSMSTGGATSGGASQSAGTGGSAQSTGGAPASGGTGGGSAGRGVGGKSSASGGMGGSSPTSGTGGTGMAGASTGGSAGAPNVSTLGELPGSACTKTFTTPAFADLKTNAKMPDPFTFLDGSKVATKDVWVCRQKEIAQLAQAFIYGPKPGKPETFTATWSSGTLKLDMQHGGQSWSLSVPIKVPSGTGPFPAMFDVDAGAPAGVASIGVGLTWLTTNVAGAGSGRGASGKFYDFFPESKKTGSLMAWAWVASRIVDGLIATTGHNIDVTKLYGLGCSRNGKTAATMALFDQRVAMVGMQSPGSGTTSGWRIADAQTSSVQTADEIYGETTWMGDDFGQFGKAVNKLPIDQHEVLALAWPRPMIVREGTNDSWNCPVCVYTTLKYTELVYEALGSKDMIGFTHYNGGHCESGGQAWTDTYNAFVKHYITPADGTTSTAGMFDEKFTFDATKWQDGALMSIP
jgi:hypothetical protein